MLAPLRVLLPLYLLRNKLQLSLRDQLASVSLELPLAIIFNHRSVMGNAALTMTTTPRRARSPITNIFPTQIARTQELVNRWRDNRNVPRGHTWRVLSHREMQWK